MTLSTNVIIDLHRVCDYVTLIELEKKTLSLPRDYATRSALSNKT